MCRSHPAGRSWPVQVIYDEPAPEQPEAPHAGDMAADSNRERGDEQPDADERPKVGDALRRLVQAAALLEQLRQQQLSVARDRDAAMAQLHDQGLSYAEIAKAAGTTRGRVAQIVRCHRTEATSAR